MAFCNKCGKEIPVGANNCPNCGAPAENAQQNAQNAQNAQDFVNNIMNTADTTSQFDPQDINDNKAMAILAYLHILVLIPLLAAPNSKFARFHTNQGFILFIFAVAAEIICTILGFIPFGGFIAWLVGGLCHLAWLALVIIGVVNAANGKAKELPIIGKITLLK